MGRGIEKIREIKPVKIIYNNPATIVFWEDGTKTVVKREANTEDDKYAAVCAALAIKMYSTNSHFKRIIKDAENAKEIRTKSASELVSEYESRCTAELRSLAEIRFPDQNYYPDIYIPDRTLREKLESLQVSF